MDRNKAAQKNVEGLRLLKKGQYDEAIKLFSEAIEINPKRITAWLNRSKANRKLGREVQADFDNSEAEILREAARQDRKRLKAERNWSGWKLFPFVMGIAAACGAVIGSVYSLPIYPSWLRVVLSFAILVASFVVLGSGKHWLQILFFAALGILVVYTIIGVILGNIEWIYPGGYKGP